MRDGDLQVFIAHGRRDDVLPSLGALAQPMRAAAVAALDASRAPHAVAVA